MTQRRKIHRFHLDGSGTEYPVRFKEDILAAEEPLEIRIGGRSFAVTMRTPGDDFDLVAGFLVSEGIISSPSELVSLRFCTGDAGGEQTYNVVEAQLRPDVPMPDTMRHVYTSSSCGICGTDSIDSVRKTLPFDPAQDTLQIPVDVLAELPERLREAQAVFDKTGGVHAAGLFKVDGAGPELLCLREDVGRHNAVDKVVGWALRQNLLPLSGTVLQVSGRASFELVQKGRHGRHSSPVCRERAFKPGRRPRRRDRTDAGWIQPGTQPERLRRSRKGGLSVEGGPRGNLCQALTLFSPSSAMTPHGLH